MGQEAVLATIAAFGPCSSKALRHCLRQNHAAIGESLRAMKDAGEIRFMPSYTNRSQGLWVVV